MGVLSSELRKELEMACVRGRKAAERSSRSAIGALGVLEDRPPTHLGDEDRALRRALRAKRDQLGDAADKVDLLAADCAYEQWHRLLFARFLAENGLLIHPQFKAPLTLAECEDLAAGLGEPDAWAVAGRFAAEILPGIFRLDDPCVRLRLAPEGRLELEDIVERIPAATFAADDALGWVYQHWQKERKDEVNASERKIGGADLAPVTQLFTENYMVRFLLENSLGAWWASRHPDSPLVHEWEYLRLDNDGKPAVGSFDSWPTTVAEVTFMDPCCGSGHFLVEAFTMLWRMRAEEECLDALAAQDAVLRDNLFGLELDPRCVQIAMFAVAMAAWKAGGGWRALPVPNVACSGVPVKAPIAKWLALAGGDARLEGALARLHALFKDADSLGSLIDPRAAVEGDRGQQSFDDVDWDDVRPVLAAALSAESTDPGTVVLRADAESIMRAAAFLARRYDVVATNPPFLTKGRLDDRLKRHVEDAYPVAAWELAISFIQRTPDLLAAGGAMALVTPQGWLTLTSYREFRRRTLPRLTIDMIVPLGSGAFGAITGEVVQPLLLISRHVPPPSNHRFTTLNAVRAIGTDGKAMALRNEAMSTISQDAQATNPDQRIVLSELASYPLLDNTADGIHGLGTKDSPRFIRQFWEVQRLAPDWEFMQSTVPETVPWGGMHEIVYWQRGAGVLHELGRSGDAILVGASAYGRPGVLVSQTGGLACTLYWGGHFFKNAAAICPADPELAPAVWAFCSSPEFKKSVRLIDQSLKVTNRTLVKVPFDLNRWRAAAEAAGPLPGPHSNNPTQWVFKGHPDGSTDPLQVAVARLLGYRWPDQPQDDGLNAFADTDGIVCLPSVLGEATAADRLHQLLARAFEGTWSPVRAAELLAASGARKTDLESWLRDEFFRGHCQLFKNRPFVWHVWDGRKDGFGALVNYHRLDRPTLERLTYTYLGDWIERQTASAREDVVGAEERLLAARELKHKLELILAGEPPYDVYVRWKRRAEQAIGWAPDLNDGARLNVRPFVQAGVLRTRFNVKWEKDRGKNPDGSERQNDLHLTNAEKQAARA